MIWEIELCLLISVSTCRATRSGPVSSTHDTPWMSQVKGRLVSKWYSITSHASQNRGTSSNTTSWLPSFPGSIDSLHIKQIHVKWYYNNILQPITTLQYHGITIPGTDQSKVLTLLKVCVSVTSINLPW